MKDSIGSTVLMKIFVVFMVVYIILMASILNYTKTFRIKNQVVNIINRHGGYTASAESEITDYISKSSIYGKCNLLEGNNEFGSNKEDKCEIKEYQMTDAAGGSYYKVRVYVTFQFPLIKQTLQIPITGETKRLYGAPSTPGNGPKYDIVNRSYNPNDEKVDLDIKEETCDPPPPPPPPAASGCCTPTVCGSGRKLGYSGGSCACFDADDPVTPKGSPSCNTAKPGRKMANNKCYCCYDCNAKAELDTVSGQGGSTNNRSEYRRAVVNISDPGYVGMGACSGGTKDGNSVVVEVKNMCANTRTITCTDMLGNASTKTVNIYTKDPNCINCVGDTCSKCEEGYRPSGGSCIECLGCTECDKDGKCSACKEGYYLSNNKCWVCGSNCAKCNNLTCITCKEGYRKVDSLSSKNCEKCSDDNCLECPTSKGICMKCAEGYKLSSGKCVEDKGKCYKCCVSQGCTYRWSETGSSPSNTCVVDSRTESKCVGGTSCSNISNCAECTSNSKGSCTSCNRGYKLTNGNCIQNTCVSPCTLCDEGGNDCYTCAAGYYHTSSDDCSQCPNGCTACSSSTSCSACDSNHILKDSKCCTKKSNCSTYLANCNCDKCESGYETDGKGGCKKKSSGTTCQNITGCIQYNTSDCTCSLCNSAYNKKNGKCELKDDTITCTYPKYLCSNGTACCQNCSNASKPTCLAGKCTSCNTATGQWKACAPRNCLAQ